MAVKEEMKSLKANMLMNMGISASGNVVTKSIGIGTLNTSAWDAQKALNIIDAVSECLTQPLYSAEASKVYRLSED